MAKTNGTTLLEQHLEKLVLAASVLILVLAVAFRAASSPRKVDEILVSQAQALEARLQAKQPERPDPPEYLAKLKDRIGERYPVPAVEWQPERLALTTAGEEGKTWQLQFQGRRKRPPSGIPAGSASARPGGRARRRAVIQAAWTSRARSGS